MNMAAERYSANGKKMRDALEEKNREYRDSLERQSYDAEPYITSVASLHPKNLEFTNPVPDYPRPGSEEEDIEFTRIYDTFYAKQHRIYCNFLDQLLERFGSQDSVEISALREWCTIIKCNASDLILSASTYVAEDNDHMILEGSFAERLMSNPAYQRGRRVSL